MIEILVVNIWLLEMGSIPNGFSIWLTKGRRCINDLEILLPSNKNMIIFINLFMDFFILFIETTLISSNNDDTIHRDSNFHVSFLDRLNQWYLCMRQNKWHRNLKECQTSRFKSMICRPHIFQDEFCCQERKTEATTTTTIMVRSYSSWLY